LQRAHSPHLFPYTTLFRSPARSLAGKIFLGSTLLVIAVLGATFGVTSIQANRTADAAVDRALQTTRQAVADLLAARTRAFAGMRDRKSTRLNSSHVKISYA